MDRLRNTSTKPSKPFGGRISGKVYPSPPGQKFKLRILELGSDMHVSGSVFRKEREK